eukprot:TRINITY_DN6110_c1_g1_i1.p1 TRINITY_DN6110_c1_g1~~TRINITY_DN6110_c1_g1_i1.p1  ORF type:complete len:472 (+),score=56.26 TRINITY_DN6110_c1_g1_i1:63-1478(+)
MAWRRVATVHAGSGRYPHQMGVVFSRHYSKSAPSATKTPPNDNKNTDTNTYKGVANIPSLLQAATDRFEYRDAVVCDLAQARWTFMELNHHVQSLASGFTGDGLITKGKVLATMTDASLECVTVPLASAALGAVYTNLPPLPSSVEELVELLQTSEARTLVFPPRHGQRDNVVFMNQVVPELCLLTDQEYFRSKLLPHIRCLFLQSKYPENGIRALVERLQPGVVPLPYAPASSIAGSDIAFTFTSPVPGSKPAFQLSTFSQEGVVAAGKAWQESLNLTHDDRICVGSNWSRTLATAVGVIAPLHAGAVTILPAPYVTAEPILRSVDRDHATHLLLDTQSASSILKHPLIRKVRPTNLRSIILEVESTEKAENVTQLVEQLSTNLGSASVTVAFSHPSVFGAFATASASKPAQLLPYLQAKSGQSGLSFKGAYASTGTWKKEGAKDGWVQTSVNGKQTADRALSLPFSPFQ